MDRLGEICLFQCGDGGGEDLGVVGGFLSVF